MLVRKNRFVAGRGRSLDEIPSLLRALLLLLHCYRSVWPSKLSNVVVPVVRISGRQRRAGAASMRACVWSAARAELAICKWRSAMDRPSRGDEGSVAAVLPVSGTTHCKQRSETSQWSIVGGRSWLASKNHWQCAVVGFLRVKQSISALWCCVSHHP